jgi:gliding motility-associated-like protein
LGAEVVATITPSGNLVICNNQSITLTSSSNTGNVWSTLATSPSIEVTTSGEYTLTVTGVCNTDVATVTVSNGSVTADFSASPQNGPAPLTSIITDESENGDQIIWTINGESVNIISGADRVFEAGEYEVQQLVISTEGCRDSIIRVIKSISDLVELLVPNSFTPNGDSKNDTFKAVTFGIVELEGSIYNRWGEQIFSWEGPNNGWDGRTKGRMSPDGVYFYLITAKDTFQKAHEKYGSITLLR